MSALRIPDPDLRALVTGEVIVAFAARGTIEVGEEVDLEGTGPRPETELKAAYRHWGAMGPPAGAWTGVVDAVHPAALLDDVEGNARHHLVAVPEGDLVVLRVYGAGGPVLSDTAFAARLRSLGQAL